MNIDSYDYAIPEYACDNCAIASDDTSNTFLGRFLCIRNCFNRLSKINTQAAGEGIYLNMKTCKVKS